MVLIVAVEADSSGKIDIVELQRAFSNPVEVVYMAVQVRNDMKRHCHIVHFPDSSLPIHHPLAPVPARGMLPAVHESNKGISEVRVKCVATGVCIPEKHPGHRGECSVEFFAVEDACPGEIIMQVRIESCIKLFR